MHYSFCGTLELEAGFQQRFEWAILGWKLPTCPPPAAHGPSPHSRTTSHDRPGALRWGGRNGRLVNLVRFRGTGEIVMEIKSAVKLERPRVQPRDLHTCKWAATS